VTGGHKCSISRIGSGHLGSRGSSFLCAFAIPPDREGAPRAMKAGHVMRPPTEASKGIVGVSSFLVRVSGIGCVSCSSHGAIGFSM
jgi:hypothetical protein